MAPPPVMVGAGSPVERAVPWLCCPSMKAGAAAPPGSCLPRWPWWPTVSAHPSPSARCCSGWRRRRAPRPARLYSCRHRSAQSPSGWAGPCPWGRCAAGPSRGRGLRSAVPRGPGPGRPPGALGPQSWGPGPGRCRRAGSGGTAPGPGRLSPPPSHSFPLRPGSLVLFLQVQEPDVQRRQGPPEAVPAPWLFSA